MANLLELYRLKSFINGEEIKNLYEAEPGVNSFTDEDKNKLDSIEEGAQVNVNPEWDDVQNKPSFGTAALTDVSDYIQLGDSIPTTIISEGTAGQIIFDTNFIYICVATNTWRRRDLNTW